jgi:hypothetical protein
MYLSLPIVSTHGEHALDGFLLAQAAGNPTGGRVDLPAIVDAGLKPKSRKPVYWLELLPARPRL